jgi:hypothetical protein
MILYGLHGWMNRWDEKLYIRPCRLASHLWNFTSSRRLHPVRSTEQSVSVSQPFAPPSLYPLHDQHHSPLQPWAHESTRPMLH